MTLAPRRLYRLYGLLFALSGFSGLIYESVWARFLKLFLGHAAHAQTAVLALFMGGMAIGAWAASRLSPRRRNPLRLYAAVEGLIGLGALAFPGLFDAATGWAFATVIPGLASPLAVSAFKWLLSAALLLPQSILLGATFHLMAAGLIRAWPETPARTIASLYFLNSLGAAAGAIVAGFALVGWLGLPGTVRVGGAINLLLAATVFFLAPGRALPARGAEAPPGAGRAADRRFRAFLAVAMLTGAASFLYEIGWIRMLSLVLGSSTHAFELMLSAFILGLALGAAWIARRIERLDSPPRFLGWLQVGMGLCALSTIPVYALTFDIMQAGVRRLPATETGYALFNVMSHGIALLVMLPATFCAGAVLPLATASLLRDGYGERSIGQVYTWNTVGAVAGVFLGVHLGFPLLGLKGILGAGAFLDIAVGAWLLHATRTAGARRIPQAVAAVALLVPVAVVAFVPLDARKMVSGVYRNGEIFNDPDGTILFNADGKTATVSVTRTGGGTVTLLTNGKPDASIQPGGEHTIDEATMTLLGVLPVAMNPGARTAANIGLGCGLTTHTLLLSPTLASVDTVEIEPEMVRAAKWLSPVAINAFADPRSRIRIDDARNFFSGSGRRFDIIVSEPSNPWVSGVSDLFTTQFYGQLRRSLADGGIFVQWMHLYELDPPLLASVLKAIAANFDDFAVYATNDYDILIAARNGLPVPTPDPAYLRTPAVAEALARVSIRSPADIAIRKIGTRRTLAGFLAGSPVPPNSDYRPVLDEGSPRARYLKTMFWVFSGHSYAPLPAFQFLSGEIRREGRTEITPTHDFQATVYAAKAETIRDALLSGNPRDRIGTLSEPLAGDAGRVGRIFLGPSSGMDEAERFGALYNVGSLLTCFLSTGELETVWRRLESGGAASTMTGRERSWTDFLKAVGRRDGREIVRRAEAFLVRYAGQDPLADQYVVLAASLGAVATGDAAEQRRVAPLLRDDRIIRDPEARFLRTVIGALPYR